MTDFIKSNDETHKMQMKKMEKQAVQK